MSLFALSEHARLMKSYFYSTLTVTGQSGYWYSSTKVNFSSAEQQKQQTIASCVKLFKTEISMVGVRDGRCYSVITPSVGKKQVVN